jgi:hypothetical protein
MSGNPADLAAVKELVEACGKRVAFSRREGVGATTSILEMDCPTCKEGGTVFTLGDDVGSTALFSAYPEATLLKLLKILEVKSSTADDFFTAGEGHFGRGELLFLPVDDAINWITI